MAGDNPSVGSALLCVAGGQACALPLPHVIETMRPLSVTRALREWPRFVQGLSLIRGEATPVLDLAAMLGMVAATSVAGTDATDTRYVTLRTQRQTLALKVDRVLGVRSVDLAALPALVPASMRDAAAQIQPWGAALANVLDALRALPSEDAAP